MNLCGSARKHHLEPENRRRFKPSKAPPRLVDSTRSKGGRSLEVSRFRNTNMLMKMSFECMLASSLLLVFGGLMGCKQESVGRPIHFIAPDKLTGFVQIIEDATNGVELVSTNGRLIVAIPTNRIVRVRSIAPWSAPHEESAQYANGDPIPMDLSMSSNVVGLRSMGIIERNDHRILAYVIGTEQDRATIRETLSNGKDVP